MRTRVGVLAMVLCGLMAVAAHADLTGPSVGPPDGCNPTPMSAVTVATQQLCIHRVLVTETDASHDQNDTQFSFTDHVTTMRGYVPNWWPNGGPEAGMVVTLWGHLQGDGRFAVDRWIDLAHGSGPEDSPYPQMRLVDISSGKAPEDRMVWVRATAFALDPQDNGDGDIHVQTFEPCPAAGLTTETTPPMRGYVDRPTVNLGATTHDTSDQPSSHLGDAPPVGVPVMILGETRYDFGFGWYEIHPIRAWRFLTPTEIAQQQADCAADPVPHLDMFGPGIGGQHVPIPFGFPPCTDGSEFGNAPGYSACGPLCYVAHTEIGQPETLSGPCDKVTPIFTKSQEGLPESLPNGTAGPAPGSAPPIATTSSADGLPPSGVFSFRTREVEHITRLTTVQALTRIYGSRCAAKPRGLAFRRCLDRAARRVSGETSR
jgi:hypothetical protein